MHTGIQVGQSSGWGSLSVVKPSGPGVYDFHVIGCIGVATDQQNLNSLRRDG